MYIFKAYKGSTEIGKSCYLPTVEDIVFAQCKKDYPSVLLSRSRKSIRIKTVDGESITVNSFSPTTDNDIVMFMDDDAHEYYRIERELLR